MGMKVAVIGFTLFLSVMLAMSLDNDGAATPATPAREASTVAAVQAPEPEAQQAKTPPTDAERVAFTASHPKMKEAAKTISFLINLNGHLCAQVINVIPIGGDKFEVSCIERRNGSGRVRYSFDTGSNKATPI